MIDEETLAQMNGKYVMPSDAGPAWRAAAEYGYDMSLIEDTLNMTPEQRLEQHQRKASAGAFRPSSFQAKQLHEKLTRKDLRFPRRVKGELKLFRRPENRCVS